MNSFTENPIFRQLSQLCAEMNVEAHVVGGYVRDRLLGRDSKDIDIVVVGDGIEFAQAFTRFIQVPCDLAIYKNFGTAMVKMADLEIEFVGARKESYRKNSRKPETQPGTLMDDLSRRDFTINALALCLNENRFGELTDAFNGIQDLQDFRLRTPLEPGITFSDDPLRMMRAIRFATQLGFNIDDVTFEAIRKNSSRLEIISNERISDELNKILASPKPSIGFYLMRNAGLMEYVLPELLALQGIENRNGVKHKDNFIHTLQVLDNQATTSNNLWLRWAALLHDIAKAPCKRFDETTQSWTFHGHEERGVRMVKNIFNRLKLPLNEKLKYVQKIVQLHHRPKALAEEGVTDSAIRRLIVDAGDELDDLFSFCKADMTSRFPEKIAKYRENLEKVRLMVKDVEERDALRNWQPPITGEIIMNTFHLNPSPMVGELKNKIREAILDGEVKNNYEDAYAFMLKLAKEMNIQVKSDA